MRIPALAIFTVALASGQAVAQRYDPAYPVCMHVIPWGGGDYYECSFQSMAQCAMSASGRGATCDPNPYFNRATSSPRQRGRRSGREY
jgi:Protein of unknown function (DUF3551)